jgi:hypothetical protein
MEQASNMAEALQFWHDTNNTLGINHGIGSAADNQFVALETKAGYTAYFHANDSREADLVINGTRYGFPMPVCQPTCVAAVCSVVFFLLATCT